jgi:hypothetical protein
MHGQRRSVTDRSSLGPWVRRFLLEHLVDERNLSKNTQQSYRDTLRLLLPFAAIRVKKAIDCLQVDHLTADAVRAVDRRRSPCLPHSPGEESRLQREYSKPEACRHSL